MSTAQLFSAYGQAARTKLGVGGGEPEDQLRNPLEQLVQGLAQELGVGVTTLSGEHRLAEERIRPDFAVYVHGALIGFIEVKAPGTGVATSRYKGHNRVQWERLRDLPNVLYTDGQSFALYRDGELARPIAELSGQVDSGSELVGDPNGSAAALIDDFLRWIPVPVRRPKQLAQTSARLCRVLRAEVAELMGSESSGLHDLAADWRRYLYPDASDAEFADGYAQTVTFALLLARVEGIDLIESDDLRSVATQLGQRHTLMGRALGVLTDPGVLPKLAGSVHTLRRVLGVVDWPRVSKSDPKAWLYFYEEFLDEYDPKLRKKTGSYYTPHEAVMPVVRMIDELLRTRLGQSGGFGSPDVRVLDPALGTGSFLFGVIEFMAAAIEQDLGPGAVGSELRAAAQRLIGFELQAGPYAVAELRLATEFQRRGAHLGADELRVYLGDSLSDPYAEDQQLPAIYRAIGESREKANAVKREEAVMVVLGNPPFKEKSRGRGAWIESGSSGHEAPLKAWFPPKSSGLGTHAKHLYNLSTYFWRFATWKVFEGHPCDRGVVAFVSVAGFLNGPGFSEMRADLRRKADEIWVIDCTPERHQPEVSTRFFPGVQQPLCIVMLLRDGSKPEGEPAPAHYVALHGHRTEKFEQLDALDLSGGDWQTCGAEPYDPFLPAATGGWPTMPAIDDLFAWSGSGTMPGRTWVAGPSASTLKRRWQMLIDAPTTERKRELLKEHPRDRRVDTVLGDNLPGYQPRGALEHETDPSVEPERYGLRTLDRGWIIPDKRVINQPNPGLWQVRNAPGQVYLTCLDAHSPSGGVATTSTALVPDLHHFRGSFGGRAFPLWLDAAGTEPNVTPGLLGALRERLGRAVSGPDVFAYIAALTATRRYIREFATDLVVPGLRIPLTADPELFEHVTRLGRRVLWLQTYGERYTAGDRPAGPPRVSDPGVRPSVRVAIPDEPERFPESIDHDAAASELHVGEGVISNVTSAMWNYEASGYRVISRWFDRRKRDPDGKRSSPLDDVLPEAWEAPWTRELIDLLNVVALLCDLEPTLSAALGEVLEHPQITVSDLTADGILPVQTRPSVEQPPKSGTLFS